VVTQSIPSSKELFMEGDFNRHIGIKTYGNDMTLGIFDYGQENNEGVWIWILQLPIN